jgi:molybdenum cofactor cytidylyltransferase
MRGNPVVLSRALAPEIERLAGDVGAGPLLRGRADVVTLDLADPAVALDLDTPDALETYRQASTTPSSTAT